MISVTDIYTSSCLSWDQIVSSKVAFCQQTQTLFLQRDGWPRATVWTTGGKLHNFVSWKNETKKRCSWVAFLLPFLSYTKFILCNNKLHRVCLQSLNIFSKTQNLRVFGFKDSVSHLSLQKNNRLLASNQPAAFVSGIWSVCRCVWAALSAHLFHIYSLHWLRLSWEDMSISCVRAGQKTWQQESPIPRMKTTINHSLDD